VCSHGHRVVCLILRTNIIKLLKVDITRNEVKGMYNMIYTQMNGTHQQISYMQEIQGEQIYCLIRNKFLYDGQRTHNYFCIMNLAQPAQT